MKKFNKFYSSYSFYFIAAAVLGCSFLLIVIRHPYDYYASVLLLFVMAILFRLVMNKRKNEFSEVSSIINGIRENKLDSAGQINLPNAPRELEDEIRKMYEKINNDISYLKKLERVRTEFIANVSHELRTPVFTIQGFIETLLDGAIHDDQVNKKFLEKADLHLKNLSSLVNDLIDISMMEAGEMRMSLRYFNISEFLSEIVNEMNHAAEEKDLKLVFIKCREGLQLLGDRQRIRQVMVNLLSNAIKYTDTGLVEISVTEESKRAKISVRDTGIGLSQTDASRIFERFYRVDKARSRAGGGTGLGLSIVKHIIEAHGSRIEVKSVPDQGSEFYFYLQK